MLKLFVALFSLFMLSFIFFVPILFVSLLSCSVCSYFVLFVSLLSCSVCSCFVLFVSLLSCSVCSCFVLFVSLLSCSVCSCFVLFLLYCLVLSVPILFFGSYLALFCSPTHKPWLKDSQLTGQTTYRTNNLQDEHLIG